MGISISHPYTSVRASRKKRASLIMLKNQFRLDSDFHSSLLRRPGGSVCRMHYIALKSAQSSFIDFMTKVDISSLPFCQVCAYQEFKSSTGTG
jgi:hypothetical protein